MTKKRKLELLSEAIGEPVTIGRRAEYITLKIGGKVITEGESEVNDRIDVLIREYGLQFEE